jgi:hypothetical protein
MASLFHVPAFRTALRRSTSAPAVCDQAVLRKDSSASISIPQLWRESLQMFSAHSGAMLLCALFGLSSPFLVGCWIATQAVLQDMAWVGPVPTLQEKLPPATLAVLGVVGWLMISFTRGLLTGLALQRGAHRAAWDALTHLPALLVSSLVYSALVAGCLLGLSPIAKHDPALSRDSAAPIWLGWTNAMADTRQQIANEALPVLLPDAGAPFADLVPAARAVLYQRERPSQYILWISENAGEPVPSMRDAGRDASQAVMPAILILLIVTETLLRFRIVLAIKPSEVMLASTMKSGGCHLRRFAALLPLIDSARFGLRHFGVITLHIWLLRLAGAALVLLFVALPMAASTQVMVPALIALTGKTPLLPAWHFVLSSLAAFVAALVIAFSTVYDARLFAALQSDVE